MKEKTTAAMTLTYDKELLTVTFKEKTVIDAKDVLEYIAASKELVKDDKYVVLIDGRTQHFMVQKAQDMLKTVRNPNRLALAILTNDPATEQRVENYINSVNPVYLTQQFKDKEKALSWLNGFLVNR